MSYFTSASLILPPVAAYTTGSIWAYKPLDSLSPIPVVRASAKRVANKNAIITTYVNNVPAHQWGGTLITNFMPNTEAISASLNQQVSSSVNDNLVLAPDQTMTADRLNFLGTGAYRLRTTAIASGSSYIASLYYKNDNYAAGERIQFNLSDGVSGSTSIIIHPFDNVFTASAAPEWLSTTASIQSVGDDWYRASVSGISTISGSGWFELARNNANKSLYVWGLQLQTGSLGLPTTYIPNSGSAPVSQSAYIGLSVEPAATNLTVRSQEFDNANWSKSQTTVTANATTAPDGTATADKLLETATTNVHQLTQTISATSGSVYTLSCFIKAAERGFAFIGTTGVTGTNYGSVNLSTGAVTTAVGTLLSSSSTQFIDGWWRVSVSVTATSTGVISIDLRPSPDGIWANRLYLGVATDGIFIWGAQMETGLLPTSYIPTEGSNANRSADSIAQTGAQTLIGQTEGTLFIEWENQNNGLSNLVETYNQPSGISGTSSILIQKSANNVLNIRVFDSLSNYGDTFTVTMPIGKNKVALAYQLGSAVLYLNGVSVGSNSRTYIFGSPRNTLAFDPRGAYPRANFVSFLTRLSNAELAQLTTGSLFNY